MKSISLTALLLGACLTPAMAFGATLSQDTSVGVSVAQGTATGSVNASVTAELETNIVPFVIKRESNDTEDESSTSIKSDVEAETAADARLRSEVNAIAAEDANVSAVSVSDEEVMLAYRQPAKLFGFISITVPVKVAIAASGDTEVRYPWYRFLLATNQESVETRVDALVRARTDASAGAEATLSAEAALELVESLHAVLQSEATVSAAAAAN